MGETEQYQAMSDRLSKQNKYKKMRTSAVKVADQKLSSQEIHVIENTEVIKDALWESTKNKGVLHYRIFEEKLDVEDTEEESCT